MAAVIGALRAELSASIAEFQSDLGKAAGSLKEFAVEAKAIGKEMVEVGEAMAIAITGPLLLMTKAAVDQALEMRAALGQVNAALASTGGASGKTSDQLQTLAGKLEDISTFDKANILKDVTANLLRFGNVQGPIFDRAETAIVNMAARNGDLAGSTIKVGRALNDPIKGIMALTRAGIQFTTAEKDHIKVLVQSGQGYEAQNLILEKLEQKFNGAAQAARNASPTAALNQAWRDLKDTFGEIVLKDSQPLIDFLTNLTKSFTALTPAMQESIVKWGAIAAIAGPVIAVFGSIIKVVARVAGYLASLGEFIAAIDFEPLIAAIAVIDAPLLAIGAVVAGVLVWVYEFRDVFLAAADAIWKEIQNVLAPAWQYLADSFGTAWGTLVDVLKDVWNGPLGDFFKLFLGALAQLVAYVDSTIGVFIIDVIAGFLTFLGASVKFIVDSLGAVVDFLDGDWSKAWKHATDAATDAMEAIDAVQGKGPPKRPAVPVPPPPPKPVVKPAPTQAATPAATTTPDFDLHNDDAIKKLADATKSFEDAIGKMQDRVAKGLDELTLPKSITQANDLNRQIDDFVKKAQDAGVSTGKWSTQIAALRARIDALKIAGLAKEAKAFSQEVDADAVSVDKFSKGGLPPLQEKLAAVDDQYKQLHDKIQNEIDANKALADSNADAAAAMARLQKILDGLPAAHDKATAAAIAQYNAEQTLAHLQSQGAQLDTKNSIQDLLQNSGRANGPISSSQDQLQQTTRDLQKQQLDAETQLQELIAKRAEGENTLSDQQKADLDAQIGLQKQLYDLVSATTADQLTAAKQINDAFKSFTDDLSDHLATLASNLGGSWKDVMNDFKSLAEKLFIKPVTDEIASQIGGALKSLMNYIVQAFSGAGANAAPSAGGGLAGLFSNLFGGSSSSAAASTGAGIDWGDAFAGAFAGGGAIGPGQWGIVGEEGPEKAYGGMGGMTVYPNGTGPGGGGVVQNFNVTSPDANSFRLGQRQLQRTAKRRLGMS